VTDREVLEDNYGGEPLNGTVPITQRNQIRTMKRFTNAYMLVYVRAVEANTVLSPFTEVDTPPHLSKCRLLQELELSTSADNRTTIRRRKVASRGQKT
jgi:ubiquitin carboxyl-terminal hydrolase 7